MRGYFAIGIQGCKTEVNVGTLWRSAYLMGADYIFTIGKRYKTQSSDTVKAWRHIPLFHFATFEHFFEALPREARLIGVELDERAIMLQNFIHPQQAVYLLGAEDNGLTKEARDKCQAIIQLPGEYSMNVAVAGSIVMYDRIVGGVSAKALRKIA